MGAGKSIFLPLPGKRPAALLLGVLVLSASLLHAREGGRPSLEREVERLKEEIYAIHLVNRLQLTPNQIDFLLAQLERVRPYLASFEEELPAVYALQREAFREFRAEDEANRGFSPQVEQHAARALHRKKALEEKRNRVLESLARPVYEILTEEQRRIVDAYRPVLFDRKGWGGGPGAWEWRIRTVRESLLEAVRLPEGAYRREKKRIVRRMVNVFPPHLLGPVKRALYRGRGRKARAARPPAGPASERENRDQVTARLGELLDELRALPEAEARAEIDRVVEERIFASRVRQVEMEIRRIQRSKHEGPSKAARYLLNPGLVPYLEKLRKRARPAERRGSRSLSGR